MSGKSAGLRRVKLGDGDRLGNLDRGALVPAPLVAFLRRDRLVHTPGRGHGELFEVVRDLAAQPHRRGDHQPASLRLVLDVVLVPVRAVLVGPADRDAPVLLRLVRVSHVGSGLVGVGVSGGALPGQLPRRDPPHQVHHVGYPVEDLLGSVQRSEQLPFQDADEILRAA